MSARGLRELYGGVVQKDGLTALWDGRPLLYVGADGDAAMMAGGHWAWGFCWCQPTLNHVPHGGHEHFQITHRRVLDMADEAYDDRGHPGAAWVVDHADGAVYPKAGDTVQ